MFCLMTLVNRHTVGNYRSACGRWVVNGKGGWYSQPGTSEKGIIINKVSTMKQNNFSKMHEYEQCTQANQTTKVMWKPLVIFYACGFARKDILQSVGTKLNGSKYGLLTILGFSTPHQHELRTIGQEGGEGNAQERERSSRPLVYLCFHRQIRRHAMPFRLQISLLFSLSSWRINGKKHYFSLTFHRWQLELI